MMDLKKAARDMAEIGNTYLDLEWAKLECPELANRYWATKKRRTRKKVLQQIRERKSYGINYLERFPSNGVRYLLSIWLKGEVMQAMGWDPVQPLVEPLELPEQVREVETLQIEGFFSVEAYYALGNEVEEHTKSQIVKAIGPKLDEKGLIAWEEKTRCGNHYEIRAKLKVVRP